MSSRRERSRSESRSRSASRSRSRSPTGRREETREERRARRLAKKEAKRRKKESAPEVVVARMLGYTDGNNPFNDAKLSEKFVWKAKNDKLRAEGRDPARVARERERQRQVSLMDEVRAVKERRDERSAERELWEREQRRVQLERELGTLEEWQKHEEAFHLEQARKRTALRLRAGRGTPVDLLAQRLVTHHKKEPGDADGAAAAAADVDPVADIAPADAEFDMREPHVFVESLAADELAQLRADIDVHINIAKDHPDHLRYWRALLVVVDDLVSAGAAARDRSAVHSSVHADVSSILVGKSVAELIALRDQVTAKLASGDEGVDAGYWEHLLARLRVQLARATLSDFHAVHLERQLARLEEIEKNQPAAAAADDAAAAAATAAAAAAELAMLEATTAPVKSTTVKSTPAGAPNEVPVAAAAVAAPPAEPEAPPTAEDSRMARVATAEMGDEEDGDALFNAVVELAPTVYSWTDKYRPRKPRFLNRVHSGFVWNTFNRTHYDHDNPPPKTVQGYKFNIFYPDLVDKSKTPSYRLLPSDSPETVMLVFHAGPPYEDIAFKIVNGEWATGKRSGFRCRFQNGVLSLFFNFQSLRYRK